MHHFEPKTDNSIRIATTKKHLKITTNFNEGVCDACRWAEIKETIDWSSRNVTSRNFVTSIDLLMDLLMLLSLLVVERIHDTVAHVLKHIWNASINRNMEASSLY